MNYINEKVLLNEIEKKEKVLIVILDRINDPQNLGSCIRTSVCGNVDNILITENNTCNINKTVEKVSCGSLKYACITKIKNLNRLINQLKEKNVFIVGLDCSTKKKIYDIDFYHYKKIALIVSYEEKGIKFLTKKICDEVVKIPMSEKMNSLNVSVALGISLFEIIRQHYF